MNKVHGNNVSYSTTTFLDLLSAHLWGVARSAVRVGGSKHLDPQRQRVDAVVGCQGDTN